MRKSICFSVVLVSLLLVACSKSVEYESIEGEVASQVVMTEEISEGKTVADDGTEKEVPGVKGINAQMYENMNEWSNEVNTSEPKLTIWNKFSGQGYFPEDGEVYSVKKGDYIVICHPSEDTGAKRKNHVYDASMLIFLENATNYMAYEFSYLPAKDTAVHFELEIEGKIYELNINVISDEDTAVDIEQEIPGKQWAEELETDGVKMVVWNDRTGTREMIAPNGEYEMQVDDVLAFVCPEECVPINYTPEDFSDGWTIFSNKVYVVNMLETGESRTVDYEVEIYNVDTDASEFCNYLITTP